MDQNEYGFDDAERVADILRRDVSEHGMNPDAIQDGVIIGSGLDRFAKEYLDYDNAGNTSGPIKMPYDGLYDAIGRPACCSGKAEGHAKEVVIAPLKGTDDSRLVMALNGREHPFEGVSGQRATFFLRVMQLLGVKTLFGSNAAGILTPHTITPPALVLTHSNKDYAKTADSPLIGPNDERFGPRFPHTVDLYPAAIRELVKQIATELDIPLLEGTYMRVKGPDYESPEAVSQLLEDLENMWRRGRIRKGENRFQGEPVGVVGMSSTYEVMVAQHAKQSKTHPAFTDGLAYVTVATNYAGSVGPDGFVKPSEHDEVQEKAALVREYFGMLASETILRMRRAA